MLLDSCAREAERHAAEPLCSGSRSTSLSPVIGFVVIVFPFRAVVRSQCAKISSWLCSPHRAAALAQLGEKSQLLEADEVVALL